jgi:predicted helicase
MVEKLGIVYTPVEVVDFMLQSVNDVLKSEFDRSLSDENVHILDPFTGTGTFITRLLQSGLIKKEDLQRKFKDEIHANEIVLLAYYIAAINIETAYYDALTPDMEGYGSYHPFQGVCLTDTFQLGEQDDTPQLFSTMFAQNSERVERQKKTPLTVVIGNPPYSVGQKSANDNAQNQSYPKLEQRIADTYVAQSKAQVKSINVKSLYDSYIKAFRWASDRLDETGGGIICYISNGGWLGGNAAAGFRKCLEKEFSAVYVFDLRGNQRTSGELSRKEGGKIFGSGSRTPVAVTLLVKNPNKTTDKATIHYRDIGDYLTLKDKLATLIQFRSVASPQMEWTTLTPNEHGDWINQRGDVFETFIPLDTEKKFDEKTQSFFLMYSSGIVTARDSWVYNSSKNEIEKNIRRMIAFYNEQVKTYKEAKLKNANLTIEDFASEDETKIKWVQNLMKDAEDGITHSVDIESFRYGLYRPFFKQHLYFNKDLNWTRSLQPKLFPTPTSINFVICIAGAGSSKNFTTLMTNVIPDYQLQFNGQCFPLYYYEATGVSELFSSETAKGYVRKDAVSDFILSRCVAQYGSAVTKEDIFYYVYGFLHSPDYRTAFANDLKKTLPRLPLVDSAADFWAFSKAGRALAALHVEYESVPPYDGLTVTGTESGNYVVDKMKFPAKDRKDTILYNRAITIENIPLKAYDYIVNGKSAIEWIMERYAVTTHKASGIVNNPNLWALEHDDPEYILNLVKRVVRVSLETVTIVEGLPPLNEATSKKGL